MVSVPIAVGTQDDVEAIYACDKSMDDFIATCVFNRTTGRCSSPPCCIPVSLPGGVVSHRCRVSVASKACQTYFAPSAYHYDDRAIKEPVLVRFLQNPHWDLHNEQVASMEETPDCISAPSSSTGLRAPPSLPSVPVVPLDVCDVGVQASGIWWVVTRGFAPGIYSSRSLMIRATCGIVDPIFNSYPSALRAVKAFLDAFKRPWGVQKVKPPAVPYLHPPGTETIWSKSTRLALVSPVRPPTLIFAENMPSYAVPTGIAPSDGEGITVFRGHSCGVFTDWLECAAGVLGVPGAVFNVFDTLEQAKAAWAHAVLENFPRVIS